ncbi:hypothetical protein LOK49_Contig702G00002 [Camellia lanceoleosa]|nr:hypothetical protein LOK49_Contig702G00002 [Camellia lanceoleosa]
MMMMILMPLPDEHAIEDWVLDDRWAKPTKKEEEEEDVKPESIKKEAIVVVNSQKKGSFCGTVVQSSPMAEVKDDVIVKNEDPVKANVGCSDSGGGGSFGF